MKKTIFAVSLLILFAAIFSAFTLPAVETLMNKEVTVIIDAGHGEPDGGAVADDGTKESDLNLAFAQKIYSSLRENGVKCILTRDNENSIYSNGKSIHEKKVSDIRNRVELAKKYPDALVISIHMNTFPSDSVNGTQIFYKTNKSISKSIAQELQNAINLKYQPDNAKTVKPIPSNVYFFNHIQNECVLIECGFLTNQSDLQKLKDEKFQDDIVKTISEVVMYKLGE